MSFKQQLDQDLKKALLSGNKDEAMVLRGLKSAILYVEVAEGKREEGLGDAAELQVLAKESKKRQEAIDLYKQAGDNARTQAETNEKAIIDRYLPAQLSDEALTKIVDEIISQTSASGPSALGQVIGAVRQASNGQADGGRIAAIVKEKLGL